VNLKFAVEGVLSPLAEAFDGGENFVGGLGHCGAWSVRLWRTMKARMSVFD
jgi:hypothetical protein